MDKLSVFAIALIAFLAGVAIGYILTLQEGSCVHMTTYNYDCKDCKNQLTVLDFDPFGNLSNGCETEVRLIVHDYGRWGGNQTIPCYRCKDEEADWYCPV
jgi:hypothetical protein